MLPVALRFTWFWPNSGRKEKAITLYSSSVCVRAPLSEAVILKHSLPYLVEAVSHLNLASLLQVSYLCLLNTGIIGGLSHLLDMYVGVRDPSPVFTLAQQVIYPLSHLARPLPGKSIACLSPDKAAQKMVESQYFFHLRHALLCGLTQLVLRTLTV